jgi:2'-hydroxyisoflavone reductase
MKLLILGGTQFVGRHITEQALARNHEVTLFNRGQRNPDLFPDVEKLHGDRNEDLSLLHGREWDAVIDVSAYTPRQVRTMAAALVDSVEHYTFISTISVYADPINEGTDENAPLAELPDEANADAVTGPTYGALKVLCERALAEAMPGRVLTIRPGIVAGPEDHTDRFTYWLMRVADSAHPQMVVPAAPESVPMQIIDGRDLGRWTVEMTEARRTGIFNATGPDYALTLGEVLDTAQRVTGQQPTFHYVPEADLLEAGVAPWADLPLWLPNDMSNIARISNAKAISAGLTFLPLETTLADTYAWRTALDLPLRAGWSYDREEKLLS